MKPTRLSPMYFVCLFFVVALLVVTGCTKVPDPQPDNSNIKPPPGGDTSYHYNAKPSFTCKINNADFTGTVVEATLVKGFVWIGVINTLGDTLRFRALVGAGVGANTYAMNSTSASASEYVCRNCASGPIVYNSRANGGSLVITKVSGDTVRNATFTLKLDSERDALNPKTITAGVLKNIVIRGRSLDHPVAALSFTNSGTPFVGVAPKIQLQNGMFTLIGSDAAYNNFAVFVGGLAPQSYSISASSSASVSFLPAWGATYSADKDTYSNLISGGGGVGGVVNFTRITLDSFVTGNFSSLSMYNANFQQKTLTSGKFSAVPYVGTPAQIKGSSLSNFKVNYDGGAFTTNAVDAVRQTSMLKLSGVQNNNILTITMPANVKPGVYDLKEYTLFYATFKLYGTIGTYSTKSNTLNKITITTHDLATHHIAGSYTFLGEIAQGGGNPNVTKNFSSGLFDLTYP